MIISKTGIPRGSGTDTYRWVAYLTRLEREAVRAGVTVLVACPWADAPHATRYKLVTYHSPSGKYGHRNYYGEPELEEMI